MERVSGGALEKILWRVNRLRCMTPAEVGHRVLRLARAQAERAGFSGVVPAADISAVPKPWIGVPPGVDAEAVLAAAARVAAGRLDVFALSDVDLGDPPRWNRDPKTGVEAPLAFGKLLDYRDARLVGDIKYLWEPNRHLQLVTLAQAWALSGEFRWFAALRDQLDSWFAACPDGRGPNWASALEAAIRLINWSIAWQLLGGAGSALFRDRAGAEFRARWLDSVYRHARFVAGNFSLYSSANNHLLGEASGLFIAALAWPHWPRARGWARKATAILEREALLQNAPDGVNREQAVSYQQFTLDFLLLPLLAGRAAGIAFSRAYETRIEAMLEYLASIMDAGGNVPMIGDADDGYVVRLAPAPGVCPYRSLLAPGAALFG
ncbi:MAG TPA: heparinase II/III family protein, partial [Burkholderiales bacterium]